MERRLQALLVVIAARANGSGDETATLQLHSGGGGGSEEAIAEAASLEAKLAGGSDRHDLGVMRMVSRTEAPKAGANLVWIPSIGRSGSTLALEMITKPVTLGEAEDDEEGSWGGAEPKKGSPKFVLFEPCHYHDVIDGKAYRYKSTFCPDIIRELASCNFSRIDGLWGWNSTYSMVPADYSKEAASQACGAANLIAIKTIARQFWDVRHGLRDRVLPVLEAVPGLRVVLPVRDPRGIYQSWRKHVGWTKDDAELMGHFCRYYRGIMDVSHPRLMTVRFEDLVSVPEITLRKIYSFLGFRVGVAQQRWVTRHFVERQDENCTRTKVWNKAYTTCRPNPRQVIDEWKFGLSQEEKNAFSRNEDCHAVASMFMYPPT